MICYDSLESEELKKLIEKKKQFLKRQTKETAAQYLQKEIMFLQNEILPVILSNTAIIHSEIAKYAVKCYDTAIKNNCNGLLLYLPIKDGYKDRPVIGIANSRDFLPFRTPGAMLINCKSVEVISTDGCSSEVESFVLPLIHELL